MRGLPVTAWWGPAGYGGNDTSSEFEAYAAAGFTIALVSDRGSTRCTGNVTADSAASWAVIQQQLAHCKARGMQSLIDTYRCTPWGGAAQYGGDAQGAVGTYVSRTTNHKVGEEERPPVCTVVVVVYFVVGEGRVLVVVVQHPYIYYD